MKKEGIKALNVIQGSEPFARDLAILNGIGVILVRDIEARKRDFADGVFRLKQIVPKVAQIAGVGIPA